MSTRKVITITLIASFTTLLLTCLLFVLASSVSAETRLLPEPGLPDTPCSSIRARSGITRVLTIGPYEFQIDRSGVEFFRSEGNVGPGDAGAEQYWFAAVHLPDGATVTRFTSYWVDRSADNITIRLVRRTPDASSGYMLAGADSIGSSGAGKATTNDIGFETIDNANYHYFVMLHFTDVMTRANAEVQSVQIEYDTGSSVIYLPVSAREHP